MDISLTSPEASREPDQIDIFYHEQRSNICSQITNKISQAFSWCVSFLPRFSRQESDVYVNLEDQQNRRLSKSFIFNLSSGAGLVTSSILVAHVINQVAENCFNAEIESQATFDKCNEPYGKDLVIYHSLLALFSFFIGYAIEKRSEISQIQDTHPTEKLIFKLIQKIKTDYSYETALLLIYLYNGIGINVSDISSFRSFLNCNAAGLSLISSIFGMYARDQLINIKNKNWIPSERTPPISILKMGTIFSVGTISFIITAILSAHKSQKYLNIIRDLSLIGVFRSLGFILTRWLDQQLDTPVSTRQKVALFVSSLLNFYFPLTIGGYCVFFIPSKAEVRLNGLALIGLVQGAFHSRIRKPISNEIRTHNINRYKICSIIKENWPTAALIIFSSLLAKFRFLDCEGTPSIFNYSCPIGLELSGYLSGNQIVIDSKGVNIAIITGLIHYHALKIFILLQNQEGVVQYIARSYLQINEAIEFDLLSLLPYALFQSGDTSQTFETFYRYNSLSPLLIIGATFASQKGIRRTIYGNNQPSSS